MAMGARLDNVQIEGTAFRLANIMIKSEIPGLQRMSLIKDTVRIGVPDGDFVIKIMNQLERRTTRLDIQVTFRETDKAGEIWWAQWYVDVPQPSTLSEIGDALIEEISSSRRYFTTLLEDASAAESGSMPSAMPSFRSSIKRRRSGSGSKVGDEN